MSSEAAILVLMPILNVHSLEVLSMLPICRILFPLFQFSETLMCFNHQIHGLYQMLFNLQSELIIGIIVSKMVGLFGQNG